jgi:hypothetical protein
MQTFETTLEKSLKLSELLFESLKDGAPHTFSMKCVDINFIDSYILEKINEEVECSEISEMFKIISIENIRDLGVSFSSQCISLESDYYHNYDNYVIEFHVYVENNTGTCISDVFTLEFTEDEYLSYLKTFIFRSYNVPDNEFYIDWVTIPSTPTVIFNNPSDLQKYLRH